MTKNKAQKQSREMISNALSAASEILNLPNRSAQEMIDISQKLADRIIQAAKELSGSGVKSAVNVQPESVNSSEIASISDILKEYKDNSVVAKRKYDGKRLTFYGEITEISETLGDFCVDIMVLDDEGFPINNCDWVQCYFDSKYENIILSLKEGQTIAINGEWYRRREAFREGFLTNCEIVNTD